MNKTLLCLTAVIGFSLLNVATADPLTECHKRAIAMQSIEALPFCQEACDQNDGLGCHILGDLYAGGVLVKVVELDYHKAKTYYEKACNLNFGLGCESLGDLYRYGKGVRQDYKQAETSYRKACNLHNTGTGCFSLGMLYEYGKGEIQSFQKAKKYYGKACDLGYQEGCDAYRRLNDK